MARLLRTLSSPCLPSESRACARQPFCFSPNGLNTTRSLTWLMCNIQSHWIFLLSITISITSNDESPSQWVCSTTLMHIMNSIVVIKLWTRPSISVSDHTGKLFQMDGQAYYWRCEDENLSFSLGLDAFIMWDKVHTVSLLYLGGRCWTPGARLFVLGSLPHCVLLSIILFLYWLRSWRKKSFSFKENRLLMIQYLNRWCIQILLMPS